MNKLLGGTLGSFLLVTLLSACGGNQGTKVTVAAKPSFRLVLLQAAFHRSFRHNRF